MTTLVCYYENHRDGATINMPSTHANVTTSWLLFPTIMTEATAGPKVLILGGVGMIGRNLVHHLTTAAKTAPSLVRVADKRMPFMAFMK